MLTAGGDLIFPRGLPVGVVEKVVRDPDRDGLVDIIVKPAAHLDRLDEVLVITSTQPRFPPQAAAGHGRQRIAESAVPPADQGPVKASEIMAEKLPGLIDPNLPPDQQPLHDTSNPNPATPPPQPLHPDEFSPGAARTPGPETGYANPRPSRRPKSRDSAAAAAQAAAAIPPSPQRFRTAETPQRNP